MINSVAFPNVAFSRPPIPSFVLWVSSSVARPSQPASGTIARHAAKKISLWDEDDKKLSRIAAGTKISSTLSIAASQRGRRTDVERDRSIKRVQKRTGKRYRLTQARNRLSVTKLPADPGAGSVVTAREM